MARLTQALKRIAAGALMTASIATGVTALNTATPAEALPAGYQPNGCTLSPDRGWYPTYYDFKQQCNRHDYCYDEMWYGNSAAGRKGCDDNFLREMVGWCNGFYPWWMPVQRAQCVGVAGIYYTAVRNFGASYFNNPYKN